MDLTSTTYSCLLYPVFGGHPRAYWIEHETPTEWHVRRVQLELTWKENPIEVLLKSEWRREQPEAAPPTVPVSEPDPAF